MHVKLETYGGMNTFNALTTDNAADCVEMRRLVSVGNPGLVSLNDQAHVANHFVGDSCRVSWIQGLVSKATEVSELVRRHSRLLATCEAANFRYNKSLPEDAASKKQTAVSYVTPSVTPFLYNRDLMAACAHNSPDVRTTLELNNAAELPSPVKPRGESAREALASFFEWPNRRPRRETGQPRPAFWTPCALTSGHLTARRLAFLSCCLPRVNWKAIWRRWLGRFARKRCCALRRPTCSSRWRP